MKNIAVIIRVFSRVEDTKCLVEIIKKKWTSHNYSIFVAFNGAPSGYTLDSHIYEQAELITIENNSGHRSGAKDLVQSARNNLENRNEFEYVIFIESDFWLLDETLILEAIHNNKDLSTTIWIESRQSLAVDFFVVKKTVLDSNKALLEWKDSPETDFKKSVLEAKLSVHIFESLRSIHAPSSLKKLFLNRLTPFFYEGGRFRLFSKAKVVTHHIEDLPNGIEEKKKLANSLINEDFFENAGKRALSFWEKNAPYISLYFPQGSWFRKKIWK